MNQVLTTTCRILIQINTTVLAGGLVLANGMTLVIKVISQGLEIKRKMTKSSPKKPPIGYSGQKKEGKIHQINKLLVRELRIKKI